MARLIADEQPASVRYVLPETVADSNPPLVPPNAPFRMIHYPTKWEVIDGYDAPLPGLDKLTLSPGVNHVGKDGAIKMALQIAEAEGAKVVPLDACGLPSYLRVEKVRGGEAYLHVYERTYSGSARVEPDPRYWVWCAQLVQDGVIPAPPEHIAREKLAEAEAFLDAALDQAATQPSAKALVEVARHRVAVWTNYLNPPVQTPAKGKA